MISQPTIHYKQSGAQVIKVPKPIPTASLLAYWDAGLTSSYSASGQTTWFDLSGNGYHLTLTGSGLTYTTASGASDLYTYSPAIDFRGTNAHYGRGGDLCDALNPTASGYLTLTDSLCTVGGLGPYYYDNVDYTIIFYSNATSIGGGLGIGSKLFFQARSFPTDMRVHCEFEKTNPSGSTGGNVGTDTIVSQPGFGNWNLVAATKECEGAVGGGPIYNTRQVVYSYTNPYATPNKTTNTAIYPPGYKISNNKLAGTGATVIGSDWDGLIQSVIIYNKALTQQEIVDIIDYFKFRKLN